MRHPTLLALLMSAPAVAFGQDDADPDPQAQALAEQERLQAAMQAASTQERWDTVEALYQDLLALKAQRISPTYAEHLLGAQAARQRGDVAATRARLEQALSLWSTQRARDWLAEIDAGYGVVDIEISPDYDPPPRLASRAPPTDIGQRAAVELAGQELTAGRRFQGYLPQGSYTLGEAAFTVLPGQPPLAVRVAPQVEPPPAPRAWALHGRVGFGYLASTGAGAGSLQPSDLSGASPRVGVGVLRTGAGALGLGGEIGWQAAFAAPSAAASAADSDIPGSQLHLLYAWPFAGLDLGRLSAQAGPVLALGWGKATGLDSASAEDFCASQGDCADLAADEERLAASRLDGSLRAGGAGLGVGVALWQQGAIAGEPKALLQMGLAAQALSDGARWYPGGELSLVLRWSGGR